ncbi:MAG TPA: iron-sulfur cluster assembly protein [Bacteroidota bacterium]|nr:iron-sulfur cluster assembly protein [Bacteroidota bacterium]
MSEEVKNNNVHTKEVNSPGGATATGEADQLPLEQRVWAALRECYDPEIPVNLVDLGLIYEMKVDDSLPGEAGVFVKMTLTAPGCGMGPMIANDVKRRLQLVQGVKNVFVELTFDPPWNPSMMTEAAKLQLNMF